MATNFPTSLDNFTNPASGNTLDSPSHSLQHSDANDAIEAIEAKLGVGNSPAGSATAGQVLTISAAGTSGWSTPLREGLVQVSPTSVAVGSGSGSVDANGAVTFTTVSSISLNGCFSSSYDNYKIVLYATTSSSQYAQLRVRASGTDLSTSTYRYSVNYGNSANGSWTYLINSSSDSKIVLGYTGVNGFFISTDISQPFTANYTHLASTHSWADGTNLFNLLGAGMVNNTTSYDGFTLYPGSGTFTGTIRVYGYRN